MLGLQDYDGGTDMVGTHIYSSLCETTARQGHENQQVAHHNSTLTIRSMTERYRD
jgi:hypothetical protein